jgi:integrase
VIIATGKWGKQRQVPLHPTTVQALRAYQQTRDQYRPVRPTEALLITRHGDRLTKGAFLKAFRALLIKVGLEGAGERERPRPHDIRHAFAVRIISGRFSRVTDVKERPLDRLVGGVI